MRLSLIRPRFTVRRLMVVVAIVGLLLWLVVMRTRSAAYQKIAFQFAQYPGHSSRMRHAWHVKTSDGRIINYHEDENFWLQHAWATRLANKYWKLSLRPWLSAGPDPPRPELLAHPRAPADCPAELTLGSSYEDGWCARTPGALPRSIPGGRSPGPGPPNNPKVSLSTRSLGLSGTRSPGLIGIASPSRGSSRSSDLGCLDFRPAVGPHPGARPIHRGLRCEPRRLIAFERTRFSIGHHVPYRSALIRLCDRVGALCHRRIARIAWRGGPRTLEQPPPPPDPSPRRDASPRAGPGPRRAAETFLNPRASARREDGVAGVAVDDPGRRRVLFVSHTCYLDSNNGASVASRSMMESLGRNGFSAAAM